MTKLRTVIFLPGVSAVAFGAVVKKDKHKNNNKHASVMLWLVITLTVLLMATTDIHLHDIL